MGRHGVRSSWNDVPPHVRSGVEAITSSPIIEAVNLSGGFSPGPAARCRLANGGTVFVKAAGTELNPVSPHLHRREGQVLAGLDEQVPAPGLLGVVDDGDWVALVIEWIDGTMPMAPLTPANVDRFLDLVGRIGSIEASGHLEPCGEQHRGAFGHWQRLADDPIDRLDQLDDWSTSHLDRLVEMERQVDEAIAGNHLVHFDLRTDNVVLATAGSDRDVVVDWPGAARGAPWVDLVGSLPALELDGGPAPEEVFEGHHLGRAADPDAVNALLAALAGYFTRMSLLPPPPGLPTVRRFQAAQGRIARRWLAHRLRW